MLPLLAILLGNVSVAHIETEQEKKDTVKDKRIIITQRIDSITIALSKTNELLKEIIKKDSVKKRIVNENQR